jgi:hypothetical protein
MKKGFELVKIDNPIFPRMAPLELGSEEEFGKDLLSADAPLADPGPLDEGAFFEDGWLQPVISEERTRRNKPKRSRRFMVFNSC